MMNHATAFEPRSSRWNPPSEDWDRLPWLPEERIRVRRRPNVLLLSAALALATADAACSYSLGKLSVRQDWVLQQASISVLQTDRRPLGPEDARILAARMSKAE